MGALRELRGALQPRQQTLHLHIAVAVMPMVKERHSFNIIDAAHASTLHAYLGINSS